MYINHKIRIKGSDVFLVCKEKVERSCVWNLSDNNTIYQKELDNLEIECVECNNYVSVNLTPSIMNREEYYCMSCVKTGEKNPFYGKKHSSEFIEQHSKYMSGRHTGENNPFYGKKHTDETKKKISEKSGRSGVENGFYGKKHTATTRKLMSEKATAYAKTHRKELSERAIKALKNKKYKKTIPEKLTEGKLIELKLPYMYNKILPKVGQFDFIISDNILLEVHGDYWHGNPNIYGKGKRPLNERQIYKQERDAEKKRLALQQGFHIFYIWEEDINNDNWDVLYEIKRLLNEKI